MDIQKIRELLDLLSGSNLTSLELSEGDVTLRLSRQPVPDSHDTARTTTDNPASPGPLRPDEQSSQRAPKPVAPSKNVITSPMVGTFYLANSPEEKPFVQVGDTVDAGQTLCVIEAMKMLNAVEAEASGRIKEVLVENGVFVEYGQPLFEFE